MWESFGACRKGKCENKLVTSADRGGRMVTKVLCVAEKPSIAKAVANHLSSQQVTTVSRDSKSEQIIRKDR